MDSVCRSEGEGALVVRRAFRWVWIRRKSGAFVSGVDEGKAGQGWVSTVCFTYSAFDALEDEESRPCYHL